MKPIPMLNLAMLLPPILLVACVAHRWAGKAPEIGYAVLRMVVQLALVGYVLVFIFRQEDSLFGLGVLGFMFVVASCIAMRTVKNGRWRMTPKALLAIGVGGGVTLALVVAGVLGLDPWYQPQFVIPLAGMIFANAMTALSLCVERLENELGEGKPFPVARRTALNASLIPQINALFAVGLVSLPGMMTGQILSGVSPLIAARYQIMVMAMVLSSAGISLILFLRLAEPASESQSGGESGG